MKDQILNNSYTSNSAWWVNQAHDKFWKVDRLVKQMKNGQQCVKDRVLNMQLITLSNKFAISINLYFFWCSEYNV